MIHFKSPDFARALRDLTEQRTLFAFDFDGTLAPIVQTPEAARMRGVTQRLLAELATFSDVAIVSGRSISDIQSRLSFTPTYIVGNHGVEGGESGDEAMAQLRSVCRAWDLQLKGLGPAVFFDPAIKLENKIYSLTLHTRGARPKKQIEKKLLTALETLDPRPSIILGKSVINLLPPRSPHKGTAILQIADRVRYPKIFYVGDDDTDEFVFSLVDPRLITMRIGKSKKSQAHYFVERQAQINQVLRDLLQTYREKPGKLENSL